MSRFSELILLGTVLFLSLRLFNPVCSVGQSKGHADTDFPRHIKRTDRTINMDGALNENTWKQASSFQLRYEHYPDQNDNPPVKTICKVTYGRENLYIAFRAFDPDPDQIRAHYMQRDEIERLKREDHVGITIDPFNNGEWGLQFRINPMGVQADAIYSDRRSSTDYSWDAIWESEGRITENGYTVEVRIPFSSINIPSDSLQEWRISAFRHYPREVRYRMRSHPLNLDRQSRMAQFNQISGVRNVSSGMNLKINPVLTAKRTSDLTAKNDKATGSFPDMLELNPAGNLRWGIRPNINLAATVNPDFSQIEADALRFRENRRFALSFPEKRPFFLEGSKIFETPLQAVFTRSIVKPEAGLKMTGKSGDHSFGTFITRDQTSRMLFPANQYSRRKIMDRRTYSGIFRYRKRIQDQGAIGILGELREAPASTYQNYVGGIDGYYRFLKSNSVRFQYLRSATHYSESTAELYDQPSTPFGGDALRLHYDHSSRKWDGKARFTTITGGFRNDNGFFPRADVRTYQAGIKRIFRSQSKSWFSTVQLGPSYELTTDQSGKLTDRTWSLSGTYNGPMQSEVYTEYSLSKRRFQGKLFNGMSEGAFFFRLQPSRTFSKFRLYTSYGEAVDFTNVRRGKELIIHPGLTVNLSRNIFLELNPNYQRLSHRGETVFNTYLFGTRLLYHFNKRTFFRSVVQYRYVERNLSKFSNPDSFDSSTESLFYQLLFSYKVNPQSKLFLGYSSGYESVNTRPLHIQSRSGYLKVGYAWVF